LALKSLAERADPCIVTDLSRLLDDVYGPNGAEGPPAPSDPVTAPSGLPDWAVDSVLDDAFADWLPTGLSARVERPDDASARRDHPTNTAHRGSLAELAAGQVPATEPGAVTAWIRTDDDILPTFRGRSARHAHPAGVALVAEPTIESFAAEEPVAPKRRFLRRKS